MLNDWLYTEKKIQSNFTKYNKKVKNSYYKLIKSLKIWFKKVIKSAWTVLRNPILDLSFFQFVKLLYLPRKIIHSSGPKTERGEQ